MDFAALRERLHEFINVADEQHLSAIYTLVGDKIPESKNDIYDEETMKMLYQRREDHRNGLSKSYTMEEAMKLVRQKKQ